MSKEYVDRFWARVDKSDGCWNWTGALNTDKYGKLLVCTDRARRLFAHRISWALHNNAEPGDMLVIHSCDNRRCVRPEHLRLGTHLDNARDAIDRDRYVRGAAHSSAKLHPFDVNAIRALYEAGLGKRKLAEYYNVNSRTILALVRGRTWDKLPAQKQYTGLEAGEDAPNAKLTADQVAEIRRLRVDMTQREIAERFGVTPSTISAICRGKTWKSVGALAHD